MELDRDIKRVLIVLVMMIVLVLSGLYGMASYLENQRMTAIEERKAVDTQQTLLNQTKLKENYE